MDAKCDNDYSIQHSLPPEVLVFGSGACANQIVANLTDSGIRAQLVTGIHAQPTKTEMDFDHPPMAMELIRCKGFAGQFELLLKNGTRCLTMKVPAIVVAEDAAHMPNYGAYGLEDDPCWMDISGLEKLLQLPESRRPFKPKDRIAFLNGWQNDSHPEEAKRMLDACCQLQQQSDISTYFFTGNLKVAADGAESLVQQAKEAGAMFLKFSEDCPAIESLDEDRFAITCTDELVRKPLRLHADWMVVDETVVPAPRLKEIAQRLGIHLDAGGFAQADNVRRMGTATNRRGIYVAGGGRDVLSAAQQRADADRVSLRVLEFLRELEEDAPAVVTIQRGRCARCLTCHRLCPHLAIDVGKRIAVVTQACQQCGICMAGCPAQAIEMRDVQLGREIERRLQPPAMKPDDDTALRRIVVFGCARSAGQAMDLIRMAGQRLPEGVHFIEVPCGGTVAGRHLLEAFESGADGVMLCTCHTDNCQSEVGNQVARKRAAAVSEMLASAGVETRRLNTSSVAGNMGTELAGMIDAFALEIAALENQ